MLPTRLYLVRHAESTWNVEQRWQGQLDPPLSQLGQRQAEATAAALAAVGFAAIYTSPLQRAMHTAAAIAAGRRARVVALPDLQEINVGAWQGKTMDQIEAAYPGMLDRWRSNSAETAPPDGEPLADATSRGLRAFRRIRTQHPGQIVLAIVHGGISRLVLKSLMDGALPDALWFPNCSITVVDWTDDGLRLKYLNDTSHLEALAV